MGQVARAFYNDAGVYQVSPRDIASGHHANGKRSAYTRSQQLTLQVIYCLYRTSSSIKNIEVSLAWRQNPLLIIEVTESDCLLWTVY